jgi:20S proteasome subunit beta 3
MYCTPTIVGIDSNKMPFICSMDGLGAQTVSNGFAVSGSANTGLYAACEELYRPGMSQQELIALAKRIMTLALQRDVMSGCVCTIHVLNCDGTLRRSEFETDDCF